MELPLATQGNKYVLIFQDLFTKWPMVYPLPDQKTERIVKTLVEEMIPFFGVPEALLSDHGTNLLSNLMFNVCKLLGIQKMNTTAYHPQNGQTVKSHLEIDAEETCCYFGQPVGPLLTWHVVGLPEYTP